MMKSAKPIKYIFFESDDQYLKDNGFCVIDTFVGIYGPPPCDVGAESIM